MPNRSAIASSSVSAASASAVAPAALRNTWGPAKIVRPVPRTSTATSGSARRSASPTAPAATEAAAVERTAIVSSGSYRYVSGKYTNMLARSKRHTANVVKRGVASNRRMARRRSVVNPVIETPARLPVSCASTDSSGCDTRAGVGFCQTEMHPPHFCLKRMNRFTGVRVIRFAGIPNPKGVPE